jgi:hypothetical protein
MHRMKQPTLAHALPADDDGDGDRRPDDEAAHPIAGPTAYNHAVRSLHERRTSVKIRRTAGVKNSSGSSLACHNRTSDWALNEQVAHAGVR